MVLKAFGLKITFHKKSVTAFKMWFSVLHAYLVKVKFTAVVLFEYMSTSQPFPTASPHSGIVFNNILFLYVTVFLAQMSLLQTDMPG